jgi:acetyl-CoA carboxylase biotin carboxyl carrier protein
MDIKTLESLADILAESPANRLAVTGRDWSVELERPYGAPPATAAAAAGPAAVAPETPQEPPAPATFDVCAGMVGVFHYAVPAPVVGQSVDAGAILGTIESLAIRNDVRVEAPGIIHAALVEDGQPVEYGQPLFSLTPPEA